MATTTTTATKSSHRRDFPADLNPRHAFSAAPSFNLKWGCQRQLRCVKNPELVSPSSPLRFRTRRSSSFDTDYDNDDGDDDDDDADDDGGIKAVTKKLILDYRAKVDELHSAFLTVAKSPAAASVSTALAASASAAEQRPWNLRSNPNGHISPTRNSDDGGAEEQKGKRRKFAVALSKKEIESDFVAMTGARPAKRPKKRAKAVQKQVDPMFPGLWLTEITADMYKVNEELPHTSKR
ncbi:hypothetical protein vseg_019756 [Gypsophila vaccaria]